MKKTEICALCQKNEANKTNTHYFTDFLIKQALNEDGSNQRDKTTSFKISNTSIENNLKGASPEKIDDLLGREATDEEIEDWKNTLVCSVDNIFCKDCEDLFSYIENQFNPQILSKLRPPFTNKGINDLLDNIAEDNTSVKFTEDEAISIRLFFYIQIWRSHVCESYFKIYNEDIIEKLRYIILNHRNVALKDINDIPLTIKYLKTPSKKEYTRNVVTKFNDGLVINDFQVTIGESKIANKNEVEFSIIICSNEDRDKLLNIIAHYYASIFIEEKTESFIEVWITFKGSHPNSMLIQEYRDSYIEYMDSISEGLRHSKEEAIKHLCIFIRKYI